MRTVLKPSLWIIALFTTLFLAACGTVEQVPPTHLEEAVEAQAIDTGLDVGDAFAFLPPLVSGPPVGSGAVDTFDDSLLEFLTVEVCELSGDTCAAMVTTLNRESEGSAALVLEQDTLYKTEWDLRSTGAEAGKTYRITVLAAGSEIGSIDYAVDKRNRNRTVPVKFRVENHPLIRARVLAEQTLTAVQVAQVLKDEFALTAEDAAQLLADEGYAANDVGEALLNVFQESASQAAYILKQADYVFASIVAVLKDVYSQTADEVIHIYFDELNGPKDGEELGAIFTEGFWLTLDAAGFTLDEIVGALQIALLDAESFLGFPASWEELEYEWTVVFVRDMKSLYAATEIAGAFDDLDRYVAKEIASFLRFADFSIDEITEALDTLEDITNPLIAEALTFVGFTATEITGVFDSVLKLGDAVIASLLEDLGYTASEVLGALNTLEGITQQGIANALKAAGYGLDEITSALHQGLGLTANGAAFLLKGAGYTVNQVLGALNTLGGYSQTALASALKYAGYSIGEVTYSLHQILGVTYSGAAVLLKGAGYTLNQVANAVDAYWVLTDSALAEALGAAGYAASELESFFGDAWDDIEEGWCDFWGC